MKQHLYGHIKKCRVPIGPTHIQKYYHYTLNDKYDTSDYTGSYHLTITLPHKKNITLKKFINIHQEFGRQIQWIEPLLICAFFSPDLNSIGDGDKYTEGSYRIMTTGWGNLAGSDVRILEEKIVLVEKKSDFKVLRKKENASKEEGKSIEKSDDPIRMYLREMGGVELLSREGEIAIAKRIEAGKDVMLNALSQSPITAQQFFEWNDQLQKDEILVREIIDIDTNYMEDENTGPSAKQKNAGEDENSSDESDDENSQKINYLTGEKDVYVRDREQRDREQQNKGIVFDV